MEEARCRLTRGWMLEGPGPRRRRVGKSNVPHLILCLSETATMMLNKRKRQPLVSCGFKRIQSSRVPVVSTSSLPLMDVK
jgi:hypothetical protein